MVVRPLVALSCLLGLASCQRGPGPIAPVEPTPSAQVPDQASPTPENPPDQTQSDIDPADRRILDSGVAALERGEFERARLVFAGLLDRYPGNSEVEGLLADAEAGLARAKQQLEALQPKRIKRAAFRRHKIKDAPIEQRPRPPKLVVASKEPNAITDTDKWFRDNKLQSPSLKLANARTGTPGNVPAWIPSSVEGLPLARAIDDGDHFVATYGELYSGGRLVLILDPRGSVVASYDFGTWARSPKDRKADAQFTEQGVNWARVREGVLFVCTGHGTYAKSSGGLTGYLSALDLHSGDLLWRSDPVVCNARNFLYEDGYIIAGYGFTAEPDFMYVIDAKNGKTVQKLRIKSGPDFILRKGPQILVRTYDTNYVFDVR